ncbi:MAG TPA: hypothetical protein VFT22_23570 [Kofleriaceae bacterium]|nr:hypothetical protein [Kofleriaceae bacterium]
MGMVFALAVLAAVGGLFVLFVHALRADPSPRSHGWLVIVPLLIFAGWLIESLIMSGSGRSAG